MLQGFIKAIVYDRGFGFVAATDGTDYFFHFSELKELEWSEQLIGRRVLFDAAMSSRGPKAMGVRAAD